MSQPGAATPSRGQHGNAVESHDYSMWDAAYVLGSLSCAERREFEEHMSTCQLCRQAVAEISGMPALLSRLDANEVAAIDESGQTTAAVPPLRPELLNSLLWKVNQRRRRSRVLTWTFAAAAAAMLVVGLFVGLKSNPAIPGPSVPTHSNAAELTMTPVAPTTLSASITLTRHDWGTRIEMVCTYGKETDGPSHHDVDELAMVVVSRDGKQTRVATWMALDGTTATPGGSTSLPLDQIAAVRVESAENGNVFLQRSL